MQIGFVGMTLSEYVTDLVRGEAIIPTAKAIGISHGSLHRIMTGSTDQPQIETLKAIALYYGGTEQEQQDIYMRLMGLAGYLSPQPRASADELLSGNLRRMQERGRRPPTGLEGLDTASDTEGEGQEA